MSDQQVWEIIKGFSCADLRIVAEPAKAVWSHQQDIIDRRNVRIIELSAELEKAQNRLRRLSSE